MIGKLLLADPTVMSFFYRFAILLLHFAVSLLKKINCTYYNYFLCAVVIIGIYYVGQFIK
jgi:hypothetical protein